MDLTLLTTIFALFMATMVIVVRMKAAKKPATAKKIILPPLFMSTGFFMFLLPQMHVHLQYAVIAFMTGVLLSYPLIVTSKFEVVGKEIYLKRSKVFFIILAGLVILRMALKTYIGQYIDLMETAGLFFILAYGMIVPWRIAMYFNYAKLKKSMVPVLSKNEG